MVPIEWGWKQDSDFLTLVVMNQPAAPDNFLSKNNFLLCVNQYVALHVNAGKMITLHCC